MRKIKKVKLIFLSLGIILITAFSVGFFMHYAAKTPAASSADEYDPSQRQVGMFASWATSYNNIEELVDSSDFIGLIEITGIAGIDAIDTGVPGNLQFIPITIFSAKVLDSVSSDLDTIDIRMTGKRDENGVIQFADDPLMSVGEKWFIFARENEAGSYTILSGPYGRFSYDEVNDTVTSLLPPPDPSEISAFSILNTDTNSIERIRDVSLSDIREQILSYLE